MNQKVCVVSLDVLGPIRNGGVGTAMTSLAELLAENGHDVTLLYPSAYTESFPLTHWMLEYGKKNIKLETLFSTEREAQLSYLAYQWLKQRHFDVVHFHDMRGIGYWSFQAKKMGLAFANTVLVCQAHGQTMWHLTSSGEFLSDVHQLELDYLEQRSVELADVLYSPSQYMIDYMLSRDWKPPQNKMVRPNLLPAQFTAAQDANAGPGGKCQIDEVVFFGRLETRKGIELFCAALSQLKGSGALPRLVTFLGKVGLSGAEPATAHIARASENWSFPYQILSDYDVIAANEYLARPGCLAVIASSCENSPYTVLECLARRRPFLASDVGGVGELIKAEELELVLFPLQPAALAAALGRVLEDGATIATPRIDIEQNRADWLTWHASLSASPQQSASAEARPLVSICMSHFRRTHLLEYAIASIERQTYDRIELILVDDASPDDKTRAYLDSLEAKFARRDWKIIRNTTELWAGAARNKAAKAATGEYILFMDDDNVAMPHEVETFVRAALATGADILTCQQQPFLSEGAAPDGVADLPVGWMPIGPSIAQALYENCLGDLNMFVKRGAWNALGGFTEDPYGCEDYEFLLEAALSGFQVACVPEILFYYRISDTQLAGRYNHVKLYQSFMRPLRPFHKRVQAPFRAALTLASNRRYHEMRKNKVGYWSGATDRHDPISLIARAPLNSAEALTELAKLALSRGQSETASRLYSQAKRVKATINEATLEAAFQDNPAS